MRSELACDTDEVMRWRMFQMRIGAWNDEALITEWLVASPLECGKSAAGLVQAAYRRLE
jgi:hypothetical protein